MYLMMDIEISCKGHCESFSHFLDLVCYTVLLGTSTILPSKTHFRGENLLLAQSLYIKWKWL